MAWTGAVRTDTYTLSREGRQRSGENRAWTSGWSCSDECGPKWCPSANQEEVEVSISRWPSARMPYMKYRDT
eukprot:6219572-Prymnesium_polylepis.1